MNRITPRDTRSSRRPDDWRDEAACASTDPELFFQSGLTAPGKAAIRTAKVICFNCPVMEACGQWALETREPFGVFGGMTDGERRKILRRRGVRLIEDPDLAEAV